MRVPRAPRRVPVEALSLESMRSSAIRSRLRKGAVPERDTQRIHELARALARERLHLIERPSRPSGDGDLLWSRDGAGYKVIARSVAALESATSIEVSSLTDADFLLAVFLEKRSFRLLGMVRVTWSMVEWLGRPHGARWRLTWSAQSPVRDVAELL